GGAAGALAGDGQRGGGVDGAPAKVEMVNAGHSPVLEPGVEDVIAANVAAGRLRASDDPADALDGADVSMICVGTPSRSDGSLDLTFVKQVARQIGSKPSRAPARHPLPGRA